MKVRVNLGSVQVEAEGDEMTELYEELAALEEVFGSGTVCGCCGGRLIRHIVRKNKDEDKFYEARCLDTKCRAVLSFGCHKKGGGLYPHLKEKEDPTKYKPHSGWSKYVPKPKNDGEVAV